MANNSTSIAAKVGLAQDVQDKAPDTRSSDWLAMEPYWSTVEDIIDGECAVKAGKDKYLPQFPNESPKDYDFRLANGKFTNIYRDVLEGLALKPFSHEVTLVGDEVSERIQAIIEDVDGRGNHLHVFAASAFYAGINKAIDWILVDFTNTPGLRTVEEERQAGARPYWVHIAAEDVIWVDSKVIQGREQLTKVKIQEAKGKVRTFERVGDKVAWKVEIDEKGVWLVEDEGVLTIGEIPMVPFVTGRRKGRKWVFQPPMKDAADLQIKLYQNETDLEYIKTMTCFPMLAGNGVEPDRDASGDPKRVPVGPGAVLYAPPNADGNHGEWAWIITQADCLTFLSEQVKQTKSDLRELGRQPLTAQSGNLTVITTAFAASKGNSALQAWAIQLKDALESALALTAKWLGIDAEPSVSVFTDFGIDDEDEKAPEHLLKLRELGDLSQETLWDEFQRRGILGPEFNAVTEVEERLFKEIPGGDEM